MPFQLRPRRLGQAALTVLLLGLLAACEQSHPNTIFHRHTEFNRDVDDLFRLLIWLGTIVFVFVEALLIYAIIRFRRRPGQPDPEHVHGNTTLEILWTVIPAIILVVIAIPTVQVIFRTSGGARGEAVQVEVIGHQWWWEFRYPEHDVITANEMYIPIGRTVNFTLKTNDVLHSFSIPGLGGRRDLISNRVNYLWFTPDSVGPNVWNGFCKEYCGISHANMRFRVYTVSSEEFDGWIAHQRQPAAFTTTQAAAAAPAGATPPVRGVTGGPPGAGVPQTPAPAQPQVGAARFVSMPIDQVPAHAVPATPIPRGLTWDSTLVGDPLRGAQLATNPLRADAFCFTCHAVAGEPMMVARRGPDLTHFASRHTIGAGLYPNDTWHLALWLKNTRAMKPGSIMPTMGRNERDPLDRLTVGAADAPRGRTPGLSDQEIADLVAYLQSLR